MKINTRDFGLMELNESELLFFPQPIFGYEGLQRFALLSYEDAEDGISFLQSVERAEVCFVLLDPQTLNIPYNPAISDETAFLLGDVGPIALRLIAIVPEDFRKTTVNLKSPLVINTENRLATQVILEEDFPLRMPLFETQGESTC